MLFRSDLLVPIFTHYALGSKDLLALANFARSLAYQTKEEHKAKLVGSADIAEGVERVAGEERANMSVDDLLDRFRIGAGKALDNDRMLLT